MASKEHSKKGKDMNKKEMVGPTTGEENGQKTSQQQLPSPPAPPALGSTVVIAPVSKTAVGSQAKQAVVPNANGNGVNNDVNGSLTEG